MQGIRGRIGNCQRACKATNILLARLTVIMYSHRTNVLMAQARQRDDDSRNKVARAVPCPYRQAGRPVCRRAQTGEDSADWRETGIRRWRRFVWPSRTGTTRRISSPQSALLPSDARRHQSTTPAPIVHSMMAWLADRNTGPHCRSRRRLGALHPGRRRSLSDVPARSGGARPSGGRCCARQPERRG